MPLIVLVAGLWLRLVASFVSTDTVALVISRCYYNVSNCVLSFTDQKLSVIVVGATGVITAAGLEFLHFLDSFFAVSTVSGTPSPSSSVSVISGSPSPSVSS